MDGGTRLAERSEEQAASEPGPALTETVILSDVVSSEVPAAPAPANGATPQPNKSSFPPPSGILTQEGPQGIRFDFKIPPIYSTTAPHCQGG